MSDKSVPVKPHARNAPNRPRSKDMKPEYAKPDKSGKQTREGVEILGGTDKQQFARPEKGVEIVQRKA